MVNSFMDHGKWEFDTRYSIFGIRNGGCGGRASFLTTKAERHEDEWELEMGMVRGKWWMGYAALYFSSIRTGLALRRTLGFYDPRALRSHLK
jgi:hypothetical protein